MSDTHLRRIADEAHFLLCWTYQHATAEDPPMARDEAQWRVWHLHPGAINLMNSAERSLYLELMKEAR